MHGATYQDARGDGCVLKRPTDVEWRLGAPIKRGYCPECGGSGQCYDPYDDSTTACWWCEADPGKDPAVYTGSSMPVRRSDYEGKPLLRVP